MVPDWDREPVNPFKWVAAGDLLELKIRRGHALLPITVRTTVRPYPMGDTEALMRAKAKSIRADKVFDALAAKGVELRATRGQDGRLSLEGSGVSPEYLVALAAGLDGKLGFDLGFRLEKGSSAKLRLGLHPQKGFPSLLEVKPIPARQIPATQ